MTVLSQLERILEDKSFELTREQRLASILLLATCLFRLGRYAEAEVQLSELIRLRTVHRHKQGIGIALRALAEVHFRKFEHKPALETIERAIETLQGRSYYLSLASAYDTKALISGLLAGNLQEAHDHNETSLELSRHAAHGANIRWFLQTSALLSALEGKFAATNELLERAGSVNPYEKLRRRFILLLSRHCAGNDSGDEFTAEIRRLQDDFQQLQLAWYPGVLSMIQLASSRVAPDDRVFAGLFPESTDLAGLLDSHLYGRIFAAR